MRGVKFGSHHTANDWKMILNSKEISPPEPKIVSVPIEGRDGELDLSEVLTGEIRYNNREANFTFLMTEGTYLERESLISDIMSLIHGRQLNMITDDDPEHYLRGRFSVNRVHNINAYATLEISGNCEPYKYHIYETVRTLPLTSTPTEIFLSNKGVKTVVPTLKVTGTLNIKYGDKTVSLSTGEYKLTDLHLKSGETLITVSGSGSLVVTYREGVL